jgi:hypothetical protein
MKKNNAFRRAAALMAALSITVSLAAPAFAGTYYIDNGDITVTKNADGSQTVEQNGTSNNDSDEIIITTTGAAITTLESDLEGPAAEDSDFGPVVEDNYQPAQPEDAEKPEGADQPEIAEEPKSADRQESADQQAAPAAAPADTTPVNKKDDGFWGNTITVINNFADKVLNLTLKDVKIDVSDTGGDNFEFEDDQRGKAALSVQGKGNVEIELDGNNELKSGASRAGLEKTSTGKLTLKDDNKEAGSLTATGGASAAGIGGDWKGSGENITITGGTVDATGGYGSAGIGGGLLGSGENIAITGGTVNATGTDGAGIGGGNGGVGKNITITGGSVTATGGDYAAGIGGGSVSFWGGNVGSGKNITINGGSVTATGGYGGGAGIGGGENGNGEDITITGGKVNASGAYGGAGIGGGVNGIGSKVTVSGAAQVTATATGSGPDWSGVGTGATIGNGGSKTPDGPVDGKEIQADISGLTTGYIHHIIYNPDLDSDGKPDGILKEWWEFALPKPIPDGESLDLHVETLKGAPLPFNTRQQGSTLWVTTDNLSARLHGTRQALETLQEQGVEQIQFVTTLKTTTLSVADLLAEGGSWFALEHDGLGSRRLSVAQAESLKCWRH